MSDYRISVGKEVLGFAAGHFITYGGGQCEALHGHNYRVGVDVSGGLDEHALVLDFVRLRKEVTSLLEPLDHRMLLPGANASLEIRRRDGEVEVRHGTKRYVFPEADVAFLPIANTTAELLAAYLAERLAQRLAERGARNLDRVTVEVEESDGQCASCSRAIGE